MTSPDDTAALIRTLRLGLLGLAALSVVAIAYELYAERHWRSAPQLMPWAVLVVLLAAIVLASSGRSGPRAAARVLAVLALFASGFGVYQHLAENYQSGALDQVYSDSWETRSEVSRWLLAATKSVGPAPPTAPGALGQTALLVLLATIGGARRTTPKGAAS